jgi:cytochrome P450 family 142 subfamily A polypeptide 1
MDASKVDCNFANSDNWTEDMQDRMTWIRENDPVYWSEKSDFWVVSKFKDVSHVSKNNKIFCSSQGVRPGNPVRLSLIDEDEPRHGKLRNMINTGFTPRMVAKLEKVFIEIVEQSLDAIAKKDECDFVDDIAVPLPLLVIAEMIGIHKKDRERFHQWSDAMIAGDGNFDNPKIMAASGQAFAEYTAYIREILDDRRENPRDDLASILVGADQGGLLKDHSRHDNHHEGSSAYEAQAEQVNTDELVMFMVLLLVAGNETTRNGISGGMQCLIENPDARQRLIDDPELIPQAVEEMLRWVTPIRSFSRTATEDTELGDKKIKKGDVVYMVYSSANHDPDEFENPEVFDIDRKPNHVAFGIGNHFCMGANLARMEMRVAFREVLRRFPDMEYSDGGPVLQSSALVRTCKHLRVKYTPES